MFCLVRGDYCKSLAKTNPDLPDLLAKYKQLRGAEEKNKFGLALSMSKTRADTFAIEKESLKETYTESSEFGWVSAFAIWGHEHIPLNPSTFQVSLGATSVSIVITK